MNAPMNLGSVVEQIAELVPALRLVGGAAALERAQDGLAAMPAAFVLPARDAAAASPYQSGVVQQEVTAEFAVLIAARNLSDATGAASVDELRALRGAILEALVGWTPASCDSGCEYVRGEFVSIVDGSVWWQETYRTTFMIRSL